MNLEKDLKHLRKQKQLKESAMAQLRKRSKDSVARPRAEKKMVPSQSVAVQNRKQMRRGSIRNASHLQKPHG